MKAIKKPLSGRKTVKRSILVPCLLFLFGIATTINASENLSHSPSLYISMHATDKVHWLAWDVSVLEKARKENKPLLLTIGYFSCYWCHVLQKESFQDEAVAKMINEKFIPVVVDRELNPTLDARMIEFAEQTLGRGGWPLNIVLTPEGYPFMASIYLPRDAFLEWVNQAEGLWSTDPEYIQTISKDAATEMNMQFSQPLSKISRSDVKVLVKGFLEEAVSSFDEFEGGFGDQAKFPVPSILSALLDVYQSNHDERLKEFLELTLNKMYQGALHDHINDGFFRYTSDPNWQVPHFEKMLYDNVQLTSLYLKAGKVLDQPNFIAVGIKTIDFVINSMHADRGGFFSSFSAVDADGKEGGFYLWEKNSWNKGWSEKDKKTINTIWSWHSEPEFEEKFLPTLSDELIEISNKLNLSTKESKKLINRLKTVLASNRHSPSPPVDRKVLSAWNALAIIALSDAYSVTGNKRYKNLAIQTAKFINTHLIKNRRIYRSIHNEVLSGSAGIEDYVYVANAFYRVSEMSDKKVFRRIAEMFVDEAWSKYFTEKGWRSSDELIIPYESSEAMLADGPLISSSGLLISLSQKLNKNRWKSKVDKALRMGHGILKDRPFWFASHIVALDKYTSIQEK